MCQTWPLDTVTTFSGRSPAGQPPVADNLLLDTAVLLILLMLFPDLALFIPRPMT